MNKKDMNTLHIIFHKSDKGKATGVLNVPEKPDICDGWKDANCFDCVCDKRVRAYESALSEAIDKRLEIVNPGPYFWQMSDGTWLKMKDGSTLDSERIKEGELYSWPGAWEKVDKCQYQEVDGNCPDCFKGHLCAKVIRLIDPQSEKPEDIKMFFKPDYKTIFHNTTDRPTNSERIQVEIKPIDGIKYFINGIRYIPDPTQFEGEGDPLISDEFEKNFKAFYEKANHLIPKPEVVQPSESEDLRSVYMNEKGRVWEMEEKLIKWIEERYVLTRRPKQ